MLQEVSILEANLRGKRAGPVLERVEKLALDSYVFKAASEELTYILRLVVPKGQEERFLKLLLEAGVENVLIKEAKLETKSGPSSHLLETHGRDVPISQRKS